MKKFSIIILCIVLVLSTGCWDRKEIETRGYVLGIAIDEYPPFPRGQEKEEEYKKEKTLESMPLDTGRPMYAMTIQLPIIAKSALTAAQAGGGGGEEEKTWEITQVGNSFFEMNRQISARTNYAPFYEHLQVIIISERIAKRGLSKVVEFFISDPEMRRRTKVFITKGEAKAVLDVTPRIEDYPSIYLSKLPQNASRNARIIYKTDLGELVKSFHQGLDSAVPLIKATKDEIMEGGIAILKDDKMVGSVTADHLEQIKFMTGLYKGGVETAKIPGTEDEIAGLDIRKVKTKTKPAINGRIPSFKIDVNVTGDLAEVTNLEMAGKINQEFLTMLEEAFAASIKRRCMETAKLMQEEFKADVLQFDLLLRTGEPAYWKEYKDEWNEIFPEVKIEVDVNVEIERIGTQR